MNALDRHGLSRVQRYRRVAILTSILLVSAVLLFVKPQYDGDSTYHIWMEANGLLFILVAIFIRLWCTLYIGGRKATTLMTDGPYSVSRNPLYVGSIIGATGVGLQTGMLIFGLIAGLICWLIFSFVVRNEERFLGNRFGSGYAHYLVTTPRFFPNFARYRDGGNSYTFDPPALGRTLRDGLIFMLALPLTEIIEELHEAGELPVALTLF